MNSDTLVSIIMSMKNASKWIAETIESIQSQSLQEWELIVVDDHSQDDSVSIVESFSITDARVYVYKNDAFGIVSALNQAFLKVSGTYITRMDADDIMPENRLQQMVTELEKASSKTIVTGKVHYFSDTVVSDGYQKYEQWLNERVDKADFYKHIYRECIVASPNWMGRTSDFKNDHLLNGLNYPEDYDLCFRWLQLGYTIQGIDEVTLLWREHSERTSRNSEHYQQPAFFRLKLNWLLQRHPHCQSIGIIGAGEKGKLCAAYLQQENYPFNLYDLNFEKYTTPLFGNKVQSTDVIIDEIILIARYPDNLEEVQKFIERKGYEIGKNAFWV